MNEIGSFLFSLAAYTIIIVLPGGTFAVVLHYLVSLPLRRRDRALFFLDLIETVIQRGQPVEPAILAAAENQDRAIGVRFFMVAAHIEGGARLGEALVQVPTFLPPQINAMIRAGEQMGDLKKVLPACREVLRIAPDTVRTTMNYMVAILMLFAPIAIFLIMLLSTFVIPKFKEVAAGMGAQLWPVTIFTFIINDSGALIYFEILVFLALALITVLYIGGPGLVRYFQFRDAPLVDWITWRVPWKRKKLLRAFSAMLAALLDGGVPEAEAVRLAGEATANEICRRRARRVVAALERGVNLEQAVRVFDSNGEFHWRLANAAHAHGGFLAALRSWHESLDAQAFRQEETAAHTLTSGLVILNGVVVGLIATSMFGVILATLYHILSE